MNLVRELENKEFYLYSERQGYNDGTEKYFTWVTMRKENFCTAHKHWDTLEAKNEYVEAMKPQFEV